MLRRLLTTIVKFVKICTVIEEKWLKNLSFIRLVVEKKEQIAILHSSK